jgi:hypothetical protein
VRYLRCMRELVLVLGIVALLGGLSAVAVVDFYSVVAFGAVVCAAGFAFGIPSAVVYHVRLYRALAPRGALPASWYWNAVAYNHALTSVERARVLPWCYAGIAGFVVVILGMLPVAVKVALFFMQGR